jgi:hypothetical protein
MADNAEITAEPVSPLPPPAPAVGALQTSLSELIRESQKLRTDVHNAEALRAEKIAQIRRENLINLVVIGILALFMLMVLAIAWQSNRIAHDTKRNADTLIDCTTPGGRCYEEGRARTGEAVAVLQGVQLYIVECSRALPVPEYPPGPAFDRKFESCVQAKVTAAQKAGKFGP